MSATPKAVELARALGIAIDEIPGSGKSGRATVVDVRRWVRGNGLPEDLDDEAKRQHTALAKLLASPDRHTNAQLLELVRRDQDAREARAAIKEQGRFHVSASGRVYAHPGIELEREARRDVGRLQDELGLGPDSPEDEETEAGDGDEFDL